LKSGMREGVHFYLELGFWTGTTRQKEGRKERKKERKNERKEGRDTFEGKKSSYYYLLMIRSNTYETRTTQSEDS
jgi:hypothetical protein